MMNFRTFFSTIAKRGIVAGLLGVMCLLTTVAPAELPQFKLQNPDEGYATGEMGYSVSMDGDTMIVGAPKTTHNGLQLAGTALIYRANGLGGWSLEAELIASDVASADFFGWSVAVSGDTAIVGARADDDEVGNSGSAYVFTRSNGVWTEQAKLTAMDAAKLDHFGWSVALNGDTAIVGALSDDFGKDSGSAYIFTRSGKVWTQKAKLTASDASEGDEFGISVALTGDTAIVGAYRDDDGRWDSGSAYIFTRTDGVWTEQAKLTATDIVSQACFGFSVAIAGDTAIVGAYGDIDGWRKSGTAYVFTRSDGAWTEQAKLTALDSASHDQFGISVALSGETAIVGAIIDEDGGQESGSAYVFTRSGEVWTQQMKLTASDAGVEDWFGFSLAITGDTAIIGAFGDDDGGWASGSGYIFTRTDGVWTQHAKLTTALDAAWGDQFGSSVSISGDTAIVGVPADDGRGDSIGSAYIFIRSGGGWIQQAKLTASEANDKDKFGISVAVSGDTAIVGKSAFHSGSAYVFRRSEGVWTQEAKLTAIDPQFQQSFGQSVAILEDTAIVGAPLLDYHGGAACVFIRSGGEWVQQAQLRAWGGSFGSSLAISENMAIVGAHGDDQGGKDSGSAYVFTRSDGEWIQQARLTASDAAEWDRFGLSVAISENTAIIGATQTDDGGEQSGTAYIFTRSGGVWNQQVKLTALNTQTGDLLRGVAALSGDTAVFPAFRKDDSGYYTGSAYVFRQYDGVWTQQEILTPADSEPPYDGFGSSVATDGVHVLVGAPGKYDPEPASGAAYIFTLPEPTPIPSSSTFTFTNKDQTNESRAWSFVVPTEFDGTITGDFDEANERLASVTSTNTGAFGFWESPAFEVSDSASDVTRGLFLRGEVGEDSLFRAFWTLSSDGAVDQANLPTVRVRSGSSNFAVTSELLSTSRGNGDFSPSGTGNLYDQYFALPAEDNIFRLSFDVINFDPTNAAVASLFIEEVTLAYMGRDILTSATMVANLDFAGADNGFTTRNASPDLVVPETFTSTADGLLIRGVEPSPARGVSSDIIFGYWGVETELPFTGGKLYRVTWTIGSDAAAGQELEVPTFRLRVNDSGLKFASLLHVNSYDNTARMPVEGSSQQYDLWLVAPDQIDGSSWNFSFDYLVVGGAPTSEDDPTIGLYLEALLVEEYELD